jgi:hypothetical protein
MSSDALAIRAPNRVTITSPRPRFSLTLSKLLLSIVNRQDASHSGGGTLVRSEEKEARIMSCLHRILSRFHQRYRGVVILTLSVILLTMATPMRVHAVAGGTAYQQFAIGVKMLAATVDTAATSHATANIWLAMAAARGHDGAQFHLAVSFQKGRGVTKNLAAAIYLYRQAAAQNHATAQYNLAVLYSNGSGVKRDYEAAFALLLIARRQPGLSAAGQRQIGQLIAKIEARLTSTQIGRAEWQAAQIIGSEI